MEPNIVARTARVPARKMAVEPEPRRRRGRVTPALSTASVAGSCGRRLRGAYRGAHYATARSLHVLEALEMCPAEKSGAFASSAHDTRTSTRCGDPRRSAARCRKSGARLPRSIGWR
ncbi:hypothetical protein HPB48_005111 [Haemaphysalis longicornis]|uniref:Uncharacterized protein n=1 Tax=Haemaphysalis longicornis TaxID=44386 RepID=A0A9J6FH19_HAELO|nr:hypothetical protein HPB48_005111 [Haemaphysalis longicornis]